MRFEMFVDGIPVPKELRMYAESRVGLAVHRAADRLSFVGVRLEARPPHFEVTCQLEAWMRGIGVVTASHADRHRTYTNKRTAAGKAITYPTCTWLARALAQKISAMSKTLTLLSVRSQPDVVKTATKGQTGIKETG